jgi:hypothetical protein
MAALDVPYETYAQLFGERCGICGATRSAGRKLDRDHDHVTGLSRGLLCHACNRLLSRRVTPEWLRAAAAYLERAADRDGEDDYGSRASTRGIDQETER